jgi:AcrR family transcriptional regulator
MTVLSESNSAPLRRVPTQRRSRERVERILAIATELIAAGGSDALRMSEVAERAGISIGSLYQYFPDKASIIRTLAEGYNAQGRACVEGELAPVQTEAELETALLRITDKYYAMFLEEPAMRDIWQATQSDKTLQEMDAADGEAHTTLLNEVLRRLRPEADPEDLAMIALLTMNFLATIVRLAISLDRKHGDIAIAKSKRLLLKHLHN